MSLTVLSNGMTASERIRYRKLPPFCNYGGSRAGVRAMVRLNKPTFHARIGSSPAFDRSTRGRVDLEDSLLAESHASTSR